jgi:hypothetical protein
MKDRLQEILRCVFEIQECREWGKQNRSFWPIQTELDWALELRELL